MSGLFDCLAEVRVTALLIQTSGCDKTVRTITQLAEGQGLNCLGNDELRVGDTHITLASFFLSALRGRDGDLLSDDCEMEMVIHLDDEAPKITQVSFRVNESTLPEMPGLMVDTGDDDTVANAHVLQLLRLLQWE